MVTLWRIDNAYNTLHPLCIINSFRDTTLQDYIGPVPNEVNLSVGVDMATTLSSKDSDVNKNGNFSFNIQV